MAHRAGLSLGDSFSRSKNVFFKHNQSTCAVIFIANLCSEVHCAVLFDLEKVSFNERPALLDRQGQILALAFRSKS